MADRKLVIALILILMPAAAMAQFAGGSGTQADPYQVSTAAQLDSVRNYLSSHFIQTADIDLDVSPYNTGLGWTPIGGFNNEFTGTYNGDGYTITGLYINGFGPYDRMGLFGFVDNEADSVNKGIVRNVALENVSVLGRSFVGALVGYLDGTVSNSYSTGTVSGNSPVGGLVGEGWSSGKITHSYSTATVSGSGSVGGLVGRITKSIIESYATGTVSGGSGPAGGLVGDVNSGIIIDSYATGSVSGSGVNGGIAGFAGTNAGIIKRSYSTGVVSGTGTKGGFVGDGGGTETDSYWNTETSGQSSSDGGTGLTSAEMKQESSFSNWDFSTVWGISEGFSFPYLDHATHRTVGLSISGDDGWRMLSAPLAEKSYGELTEEFWTQGFAGSDYPSAADPNLYVWGEFAQSWAVPSDAADVPSAGRGFITYIFDDQDYDGSGDGYPKEIMIEGDEPEGTVTPSVSYTDTGSPASDGWNLVGNPYADPIDWDAGSGWTKTNLDGSIYIWNDASGAYQSWNGATGTLSNDGVIAPWQGFWVKANAASPALSMDEDVKSSDGIFYKSAALPVAQIRFELKQNKEEEGGHLSAAIVMFHSNAETGNDPLDTWKLRPLSSGYLLLYSRNGAGDALDINALPAELSRPYEAEMGFEWNKADGNSFVLEWEPSFLSLLPTGWEITLFDRNSLREFSLNEPGSFSFMENGTVPEQKVDSRSPKSPARPIVVKAKDHPARFVIRVNPLSAPGPELPESYQLGYNYPNPFNPATTISYALPAPGPVRLAVYDMLGRRLMTLVEGEKEAGFHTVTFNAGKLASGVYLYKLEAGTFSISRKMTLIK